MQNKQQTNSRVGIGRGWEHQKKNIAREGESIILRSGAAVVAGRVIGGAGEHRAFIWSDETISNARRELVICPDFRDTWLWEAGVDTTLRAAFPERPAIWKEEEFFRQWMGQFEKWHGKGSVQAFWSRFHRDGMILARRLQACLVHEACLRYWRPPQDPRSQSDRELPL